MAQTPTAWLAATTSNWVPSSSQFDGARRHRTAIESKLDAALGVFGMFEIGSLRHGTGIYSYSDADYLVSLKGSRPASQWTTLNNVKAALQARFPTTVIVVRQPAVVCKFSDGDIEVVPGYPTESGYWIPDPVGSWMKSHPSEHNQYVNDVNKKHDGAAKQLARQLKIWKYRRNVQVSSCYLEMRAAKYLDGESVFVPLLDLHWVLKNIRSTNLAALNDPTGLGSRFSATSSDISKDDALSKLDTAITRVGRARDYESNGSHDKGIEQLKLFFNLS